MKGRDGRPLRKSIRLKGFDYARPGFYFITICSDWRRQTFGRVVEDGVRLFPIGEIVRATWAEIPRHFAHVDLDEYVVMPNHMHGILELRERGNARPQAECFSIPVKGSVPTIIRSFKSAVTERVHEAGLQMGDVLQRGYYEHVVRTEQSLERIRRYIRSNPQKWYRDRMNR